jgi:hypothetical protein
VCFFRPDTRDERQERKRPRRLYPESNRNDTRMSKRKHHFVPKFYLKGFQSEPNRLHLYNLDRRRAILNVSLRDQCYQHRFYGKTDEVEDVLMEMEKRIAPVVRETAERQILPSPRSASRSLLFEFAVLQSLRTTATAKRIHRSSGEFTQAVWGRAAKAESDDLDELLISTDEAILMALRQLPHVLKVSSDLEMHLVCTTGSQRFATSDNPVFKYNLYCEGTKGRGTVGWGQGGFHLFLPLSPATLLILYDPRVYRVGTRASSVTHNITDDDVGALNLMQLVGAAENLYFNDWELAGKIERLHERAKIPRTEGRSKVLEYWDEKDENHALLHQFEQMPNIKLHLSFFSVRRDARKVPFFSRPQILRHPELHRKMDSGEPLTDDGRDHIRFVRPDLHPNARRTKT